MGERRDDPGLEGRARGILDQMGERLGVGLAREAVPGALQRGPQHVGVLDDAVVHQRDRAAAVDVGMGVALGGGAVGGPARVRDTGRAVEGMALELVRQRGHARGELRDYDPAAIGQSHPCRVVAAILEPLQSFQQPGRRVAAAGVPHDPAHQRDITALADRARAAGAPRRTARTGPSG